jgi:c-di-GMP-related signal transduction protein
VVRACRNLKAQGYVLALDDIVAADDRHPLLPLVDFIKVDLLGAEDGATGRLVALAQQHRIQTLAEKVETQEEMAATREIGYGCFQGYFFGKPVIVSGKDIASLDTSRLRLRQAVHRQDMDFDEIERVLKVEVGLTYKLLRFINSAVFSLPNRITSIKQALVMLGAVGLRKWVSIVVLTEMDKDKPQELTAHSILRARFCELLAQRSTLQNRSNDLFIAGLFSMIDAFLCRPLVEILAALPINDEIKATLLGAPSGVRSVYELVLAYERAGWETVAALASHLGLQEPDIAEAYRDAVQWANASAAMA